MENNQNKTLPFALAISIITLVCGILGLICSGSLYSFAFSVAAIVLGAIGIKKGKANR